MQNYFFWMFINKYVCMCGTWMIDEILGKKTYQASSSQIGSMKYIIHIAEWRLRIKDINRKF